ncbi:MAG: hypothetical protein JSS18_14855 [Proteobacteria bacterium]|nr:hypothetical protein [Pseudomonadota bacterium]
MSSLLYRPLEDLPQASTVGLALAYIEGSQIPAALRFWGVAIRVFGGRQVPFQL